MTDLLEKLKSQHAEMLGLLVMMDKSSTNNSGNHLAVVADLNNFKIIFVDHLYLENKFLYPRILNKDLTTKLGDTSVQMFLDEMLTIQDDIITFLNKYSNKNKIYEAFTEFKSDLTEITKLLEMRIRLEEDGLFECF